MATESFPSRSEVQEALSTAVVFIVRSHRYRRPEAYPGEGAFRHAELEHTVDVLMRCLGFPEGERARMLVKLQ